MLLVITVRILQAIPVYKLSSVWAPCHLPQHSGRRGPESALCQLSTPQSDGGKLVVEGAGGGGEGFAKRWQRGIA